MAHFQRYQKHTMQKSSNSLISNDDILRFFDNITIKVKSNLSNKFTINLRVMISALQKFLDWVPFNHNFKPNPQKGFRIKILFNDGVRASRLTTGTWQKKVWISFIIINRMPSAYITHHLDHGARNWDIIAVRMRSVVLIAGIGYRAGDITRAAMWDGVQFLQWQCQDTSYEQLDWPGGGNGMGRYRLVCSQIASWLHRSPDVHRSRRRKKQGDQSGRLFRALPNRLEV